MSFAATAAGTSLFANFTLDLKRQSLRNTTQKDVYNANVFGRDRGLRRRPGKNAKVLGRQVSNSKEAGKRLWRHLGQNASKKSDDLPLNSSRGCVEESEEILDEAELRGQMGSAHRTATQGQDQGEHLKAVSVRGGLWSGWKTTRT
jgi:hypothetical protein